MGCFSGKELYPKKKNIIEQIHFNRIEKLSNNSFEILNIRGRRQKKICPYEKSKNSRFAYIQLENIAFRMSNYLNKESVNIKPTSLDVLTIIDFLPINSEPILEYIIEEMLKYHLITYTLFHTIKTEYPNIFIKHLELKPDTLMHDTGLSRLHCVNYPKIVKTKVKILNYRLLQQLVFESF